MKAKIQNSSSVSNRLAGIFALGTLSLSLSLSLVASLCLSLCCSFWFSDSASATSSYVNVSSGASGGVVSFSKVQPSSSGETTTASDTLTINTNCSAGYSVYVSAQNGKDNNLTNTNSSVTTNNTITPSSASIGGTSTTLSANTWGINSSSTDVESGKYYGLPTYAHATTTALTTKADVDTSSSSTIPIYYGAKVTTSIAPGTYSGDVLYTVLSNPSCSVYTIVFNANGGTGEMDNQTINVGQSTALHANEFERTGYTFLGWSNTANGKTGTAVNGIGTVSDVDYENEASVTDLSDFNTEKTLYAIWTLASDGDMQTWTECSSLATNQIVRLKDTRDNTIYAVKKLPDGKCWMIENLTLGSKGGVTLSADNTNMQAGTTSTGTAPDSSGYYYLPPAGKQGAINNSSTLSSNTDVTFSTGSDDQARVAYKVANSTDNTTGNPVPENTSYYNFYTATLGYSYYSDTTLTSGSSSRDICPKGWRLPFVSSSGTSITPMSSEFSNLSRLYNNNAIWQGNGESSYVYFTTDDTIRRNMINGDEDSMDRFGNNSAIGFTGIGVYTTNSKLNGVKTSGYYRSSSVYDSNNGYDLYFAAQIYSQYPNVKYTGQAVRCLAQNNYTVSYSANGGTGSPSKESDTIYETGELTTAGQGTLTREGYNFLGWSLSSSATTASYNASTNISIPSLISSASSPASGSTITLYAVWEKQKVYMQGFNCNSLSASGETATLVDSRDNQEYTVYRIPTNQTYAGTSTIANIAGKCIMTKDLNLGAVASVSGSSSQITANGTMTLSPNDSNFTIPDGSGESITIPTTNVQVTNGTSSWGDNNNTYNTYTNRMYTTSGTGNYAGRGYYSWGAAMVACPKGWRLPTSDEYNNSGSWEGQTAGLAAIVKGVNASTTISNITSSPYSFVLGGYYNGSFNNATSLGVYWSSTQYSSTLSYRLSMYSSYGLIRDVDNKYNGLSVRCIGDSWDGTMQDFDASEFSSAVGTSAALKDTRDDKIYTVKRLPDGKVWMVQNLAIGMDGPKTLTSANTNIDNGKVYYLPPPGKQGSSYIDQSSTLTSGTAASFDSSAQDFRAKTRFRNKNISISNDSDTGYYNFYTATLGYSYYSDGVGSGASTRDICPKGWRLPKTPNTTTQVVSSIGSDNDFTYLARRYSTSGWQGDTTYTLYRISDASSVAHTGLHTGIAASGNNYAGFSYAGRYDNSSTWPSFTDTGGYYWTSSIFNANSGYYLSLTASDIRPQDGGSTKYLGLAVRCIAK